MPRKLITAPSAEPIELAEAKEHLRILEADDAQDTYIESLITVARESVEDLCERALMSQTWDFYFDRFPRWYGHRQLHPYEIPMQEALRIPMPPLQSVTSIKYIDSTGALVTLDPANYVVDTASEQARVYPSYGNIWPTARWIQNAVTIRALCGYTSADVIPEKLKQALKLLVANYFENREPAVVSTGVPRELPFAIEALLSGYKASVL
jgi:uncharacterized phiE125 gp8 family phage protein